MPVEVLHLTGARGSEGTHDTEGAVPDVTLFPSYSRIRRLVEMLREGAV